MVSKRYHSHDYTSLRRLSTHFIYIFLVLWFSIRRTRGLAVPSDLVIGQESLESEYGKLRDTLSVSSDISARKFRVYTAGVKTALPRTDLFSTSHCPQPRTRAGAQICHVEEFRKGCESLATELHELDGQKILKRAGDKGKGKATAKDDQPSQPIVEDPRTLRAFEASRGRGESDFSQRGVADMSDAGTKYILEKKELQLSITARLFAMVIAARLAFNSLDMLNDIDPEETTYRHVTVQSSQSPPLQAFCSPNGNMYLPWNSKWAAEPDLAGWLFVSWILGTDRRWADEVHFDPMTRSIDYETADFEKSTFPPQYITIGDIEDEDTLRVLAKVGNAVGENNAIDVPGDDHNEEGGDGYQFNFDSMPSRGTKERDSLMALYGIKPVTIITTMLERFANALQKLQISSISFVLYRTSTPTAMVIIGLQTPTPRNNGMSDLGDLFHNFDYRYDDKMTQTNFLSTRAPELHPFYGYLNGFSRYTAYLSSVASYNFIRTKDDSYYTNLQTLERYGSLVFTFSTSVPEQHIVLRHCYSTKEKLDVNQAENDNALSERFASVIFQTWRRQAGQAVLRHIMFTDLSSNAKELARRMNGAKSPLVATYTYSPGADLDLFEALQHEFTTTTREGKALKHLQTKWGEFLGHPYVEWLAFGFVGPVGGNPVPDNEKADNPFILIRLGIQSFIEDEAGKIQAATAPSGGISSGVDVDTDSQASMSIEKLLDDSILRGCRSQAQVLALYYTLTSLPQVKLPLLQGSFHQLRQNLSPQLGSLGKFSTVSIDNPARDVLVAFESVLGISLTENKRDLAIVSEWLERARKADKFTSIDLTGLYPATDEAHLPYHISWSNDYNSSKRIDYRGRSIDANDKAAGTLLVIHDRLKAVSTSSLTSALSLAWVYLNWDRREMNFKAGANINVKRGITFLQLREDTIRILKWAHAQEAYKDLWETSGKAYKSLMLVKPMSRDASQNWAGKNPYAYLWAIMLTTPEVSAISDIFTKYVLSRRKRGMTKYQYQAADFSADQTSNTWAIQYIWASVRQSEGSGTTFGLTVILDSIGISMNLRKIAAKDMRIPAVLKDFVFTPLIYPAWERGQTYVGYQTISNLRQRSIDKPFHDNMTKRRTPNVLPPEDVYVTMSTNFGLRPQASYHQVHITLNSGGSPYVFHVAEDRIDPSGLTRSHVVLTSAPDPGSETTFSDRNIDELAAIYFEGFKADKDPVKPGSSLELQKHPILTSFSIAGGAISSTTRKVIDDMARDDSPLRLVDENSQELLAVDKAVLGNTASFFKRLKLNVLSGQREIAAFWAMLRNYVNTLTQQQPSDMARLRIERIILEYPKDGGLYIHIMLGSLAELWD